MDIQSLRIRRGQIKSRNTRMAAFLSLLATNTEKMNQLRDRIEKFQSTFEEFSDLQTQIELLDDTELQGDERESFEDAYFEITARCNALLASQETTLQSMPGNNSNSTESNRSNHSEHYGIKLPTIQLPIFDGDYANWLGFRDIFESLIHNSEVLNNVQKLHYLKSSLTNTAASVIAALPTTANNYEIAWSMISERFENNKILIKTHVDNILDMPCIQQESASALRNLSDCVLRNVRALKSLNKPTDEWSTLLVHIVVRKLDSSTRRAWEMKNPSTDDPNFSRLEDFLRERAQVLESMKPKAEDGKIKKHVRSLVVNKSQCPNCSRDHRISSCDEFKSRSIAQRLSRIKQLRLCINCLQAGHMMVDCTSSYCRKCGKKHNTLLHIEYDKSGHKNDTKETPVSNTDKTESNSKSVSASACKIDSQNVLLSTAIVEVQGSSGKIYEANVLLDCGSQVSFVTKEFASCLNLPMNNKEISIIGIGGSSKKINTSVILTVKSRYNNFESAINCYVIPTITAKLPTISFNPHGLKIPSNIRLADTRFYESKRIDILLGADIFYSLLSIGQIKLGFGMPILQKTLLGWVISGKMPITNACNTVVCNLSQILESQLLKFWEIEDIKSDVLLTTEETLCENHFKNSVSQMEDGRFMVKIPFKSEDISLGISYEAALKRLKSMEKKFINNSDLQKQYCSFMDEYEELNHMSKVESDNLSDGYYLPHHAVIKESSLTTKLRVVFDASAPSSNGTSLNDCQIAGPQIQEDLINILLRFRLHEYVLTADISKMYRQVLIAPEHRKYQKILWRSSASGDISTYSLNTVTYGMKASSFLAIRCLKELSLKFQNKYPRAASIIASDFYVDDLITGSNNIETLRQLKKEIDLILKDGCFELRKWSSNNPSLLTNEENSNIAYLINPEVSQKTLGLIWTPALDNLQCVIHDIKSHKQTTKRTILSVTAQIFDPLGMVSPVVIVAKLIIQSLWQLNSPWDASLPAELHTRWIRFCQDLKTLEKLSIPRLVSCSNATSFELHGFADASQVAYGACIYLRSLDEHGHVHAKLLCSRSRVAPIKLVTLPRLELCAAVLLVELVKRVRDSLKIKFNNILFWSDSTITLAWIKSEAKRWKTFVCNRVAKIQRHTNINDWHHVPSEENPADQISRGTSPSALLISELWWHGPHWLQNSSEYWPGIRQIDEENLPEEKQVKASALVVSSNTNELEFIQKYSSLHRLQRVTAYCLRFKNNALKIQPKFTGILSVNELDKALILLAKISQRLYFMSDLKHMQKFGMVSKQSSLIRLNPFLDEEGLIRVGGRLHNALLSFDQRHPIILSSKGKLSELLIKSVHHQMLHAGLQSVLSTLRQRFWIIAARNVIKSILKKCITCFKVKPISLQQIMGDLPSERVQESIPFRVSGVDFGGPMRIVESHRRGNAKRIKKCYIAVFVCFATKAIHLDLVSDLTTEAFIACLRRFVSRRGSCKFLYSDNATNFIGSDSKLNKLLQASLVEQNNKKLPEYLASNGITWKYIPPRSPHHGGLWEAAIKSVKYHIKRTVGETLLTFEEYGTLLCQVEYCLNSRPLTCLSSDPTDLNALTPFHFLIGYPLSYLPEPNLDHLNANLLSRWQHLQKMNQDIWKRWSKEYLHQLQQRSKWHSSTDSIQLNDLVLLMDEHLPPLRWSMGRVIETHPGSDGNVRVVTVKVQGGTVKRSIAKLCKLPLN